MLLRFGLFFLLISNIVLAENVYVVGIAGGTGSGKSRLAQKIKATFNDDVVLIEQDSYYKDSPLLPIEKRADINYDHPNSLEFSLLKQHIEQLKNGESVDIPVYDFATHSRTKETVTKTPAKIVLIEGILLLAEESIRNMLDFKIYVEAEDDTRILRRLQRDISERGRTIEGVTRQYENTVKPMHHQFVEPSKKHADIIVLSFKDTSAAEAMICSHMNQIIEDIEFSDNAQESAELKTSL